MKTFTPPYENSDTSLVRVILTDNSGNTWMVFEAYPMINPVWTFPFNEMADETMYRQILNPGSLRIEILHATLDIDYVRTRDEYSENLVGLQALHKEIIEGSKADSINAVIENNDMLWFAHQTPISELAYSDKLSRFGVKYNLKGLDYYSGGIYDDIPGVTGPPDNSMLVENFDWRKRHGADDPDKGDFYYDINSDGWGWLTSVKNQYGYDCDGLCYIYGPLAAIEAVSNLYFNDHINYNLSVQHVLDCDTDGSDDECLRGDATNTNKFIRDHGVFDSIWYPREGLPEECRYDSPPSCSTYYQIKIAGYDGVSNNADSIKEALINHGPLSVLLLHYAGENKNHYMALVGYGKIKAGDIYQLPGQPQINITVDSNSEYIGHLYWILKNSRGTELGDQGYFNHLDEQINIGEPAYYKLPFDDLLCNDDTIIFFDKDKDGYWNWGISEEYELPDGACSKDKDSDDSENRIGPFDLNYHGIPVAPEMKVYMMKSLAKDYIINNSFFSFSANDINAEDNIRFYIENSGNAQLNLKPTGIMGKGKVEIINIPGGSTYYSISEENRPGRSVCMESDSSFFVTFTGQEQGELTKIKISLDENGDIPDFEFILVYNDCQAPTEIDTIIADETWTNFELKTKDYLISQGVTVTVTGEIAMAENSDIFVQNGGELIIDGGRLTTACNGLWNGIDVWGDPRHSQLPASQGTVRVKNGGIIEFARCGIENIIRMGDMSVYTGGIFDVDNGVFKDNLTGIRFWPYHNFNPGSIQPVDNFSRIKNSEFKTTQDLYDLGYNPEFFISMTEVEGVKILASNFHNDLENEYHPGIGIFSIAADFIVDHNCIVPEIPCQGYTPCRFENLEYGIHAGSITSTESICIRNSGFINNLRGVYLSATAYSEITQNIFEVRKAENAPLYDARYCGLYLDNCTRYYVEENYFYTFFNEQEREELVSIGLIVNNSGPENNEIYNNTFEGLYAGIIAQEINRNEEGDAGLQIKCNNLDNNIFDIAVTDNSEEITGIAKDQGTDANDETAPASNLFTYIDPEQDPEPEGNYYNICEDITYWHHAITTGFNLIPTRHTHTPAVDPEPGSYNLPFDEEASCPSHLSGGGPGIEEEKTAMIVSGQQADSIYNLLELLIDGGNTEELLTEIQTSWPEDGFELYSELISESPYLSDTSLIEAVEKEDVLLPGMITDVLIANPQSAKSEIVMTTLDERDNPLTDDQIADIGEGRFIIGAKEALEMDYAYNQYLKDISQNKLIRSYRTDTLIASRSDSIIDILSFQPSLSNEYFKAFEYRIMGNSINVSNTLDAIPGNIGLTSSELRDHSLYEDYFDLLLTLDSAGSTILEVDSAQVGLFYDILNNASGRLAGYVRNLLISCDSLDYDEVILLPEPGLKLGKVRYWPVKTQIVENYMKIYPNPAKNVVIIETRLKEEPREALINIIDSKGIKFKSYPIQKQNEYQVIPLSEFRPGVLFCQMIVRNKVVETGKIVVIK